MRGKALRPPAGIWPRMPARGGAAEEELSCAVYIKV